MGCQMQIPSQNKKQSVYYRTLLEVTHPFTLLEHHYILHKKHIREFKDPNNSAELETKIFIFVRANMLQKHTYPHIQTNTM